MLYADALRDGPRGIPEMSRLRQPGTAENREIIAELKVILQDALACLDGAKEKAKT